MSGQEARPLFVYGSLRDPAVRSRLLGERADLRTCPASLHGYARQIVPSFDYPFVVPAAPDAQVDGELILGLTDSDYMTLDRYEDVDEGLYLRAEVTVETPDGPVGAWTYLRGPAAPEKPLTPQPPPLRGANIGCADVTAAGEGGT